MGLSGGVRLGKLGATQNSVKDQDVRSEPLCLGEDQSDLTVAWRHNAGEKYIDRGIIPYWSDSFGDFARDQGPRSRFPEHFSAQQRTKGPPKRPSREATGPRRHRFSRRYPSTAAKCIIINTGENMSRRPLGTKISDSALEARRGGRGPASYDCCWHDCDIILCRLEFRLRPLSGRVAETHPEDRV
jgi:hypothetical protein